jgi:multidrug efflux system membrane fusion protein
VLKQQAVISQAQAAIEKDRASVLEVKANLVKDLAMAKLAEKDAERFVALAKAGAVADAEAERRQATRESTAAIVSAAEASIKNAEAQILADQANLKNAYAQLDYAKATLQNAHVQLNFTTVNAPIDGRTGHIMVLKGNTIKADEDILVTINQITPIDVQFSVPQEQFELVQKYSKGNTLTASATLPQGDLVAKEGKVIFTDNTVDATTGTVKIKAIFDNKDSKLWPGQYVNVVLNLTTIPNAVTVPTTAVQAGQNGSFVWLVTGKDQVHLQPVKTGPVAGADTSITEGLKAGDKVVTDGQIQLSEGAKITVKTEQKP